MNSALAAPSAQSVQSEEVVAEGLLVARAPSDDDPIVEAYLRTATGQRVMFAAGERDAVEAFRRHRPAAVLVDAELAVTAGRAISAAIRVETGGDEVPVIVVSAADLRNDAAAHRDGRPHVTPLVTILQRLLARRPRARRVPTTGHEVPVATVDADVEDLARDYRARLQALVPQLAEWLDAGDFKAIRGMAHSMVGNGEAFGFTPVTRIGRDLHRTATDTDRGATARGIDDLARYIDRVVIVIRDA